MENATENATENHARAGRFMVEGFEFRIARCYADPDGKCIAEYLVSKFGYVLCKYLHCTEIWRVHGYFYPRTLREMALLPDSKFANLTTYETLLLNRCFEHPPPPNTAE